MTTPVQGAHRNLAFRVSAEPWDNNTWLAGKPPGTHARGSAISGLNEVQGALARCRHQPLETLPLPHPPPLLPLPPLPPLLLLPMLLPFKFWLQIIAAADLAVIATAAVSLATLPVAPNLTVICHSQFASSGVSAILNAIAHGEPSPATCFSSHLERPCSACRPPIAL